MSKKIVFHDHVNIVGRRMAKNFKFEDAQVLGENGSMVNGIYVTVKATHAGRVTGNHGLYLPSRMKDGAFSMVSPYEKPVGLHHLPLADPVGRIKRADYISLALPDSHSRFTKLNDSACFEDQLDIISELAESGLLFSSQYEGLGYILSTAAITDPDAVQKVRDGRYQTVSITANTDHAICSRCQTDWADSRCDHEPGEIIDGIPMFLIAGELEYDGWDWVNRPADSMASVVSVIDSKDTLKTDTIDCIGTMNYAPYSISISDSIDHSIALAQGDDVINDTLSRNNAPIDNKEVNHDKIQSSTEVQMNIETVLKKIKEAYTTEDEVKPALNIELSDEERVVLYAAVASGLPEVASKLTEDEVKALPNACFIGGLPCLDQTHFTASAKYASDNDIFKATIPTLCSFGTALGYDLGVLCAEDSTPEPTNDLAVQLNIVDSEDTKHISIKFSDSCENEHVRNIYSTVEQEMLNRNLKVDTFSDRISALETEITQLKDTKEKKESQLTVLRDELKLAWSESTTANTARLESTGHLRSLILDSMTLVNKLVNNAELDVAYEELSIDSLIEKHQALVDKLDVDATCLKIHDGTTLITDTEPLKDPTSENNSEIPPEEIKLSDGERAIFNSVKETMDAKGKIAALRHLQVLKRSGIINSDANIKAMLDKE